MHKPADTHLGFLNMYLAAISKGTKYKSHRSLVLIIVQLGSLKRGSCWLWSKRCSAIRSKSPISLKLKTQCFSCFTSSFQMRHLLRHCPKWACGSLQKNGCGKPNPPFTLYAGCKDITPGTGPERRPHLCYRQLKLHWSQCRCPASY